ncbi:Poly(A) binding protein 6, putative isoform 3 [Theobroma cacao]|uniref:Poly(A) binding protein 6, putative isoform 3 n=1 Tax=Theobroma cacao TaxID=3641 RepID=A0A061GIS6_THECC|nr:Poly(A) binding protein 6, putative isoform 3 [Theobroma cacao]
MPSAPPPSLSLPPLPLPLPATTVAGGAWNPLQRASLYVGDLDPDVTELDLFRIFSTVAPIVSLRLCRCLRTGKSLRYGYINFFSDAHASKALACLNHTDLKGKPVRIMWSHRDPFPRKIGLANLFVKNLDPTVTSARLEGIFCRFGTILSCKVAEENGKSKGFGFVQFDSEESAKAAITALHGTMLEGKKLYVSKFVKKSERTAAAEEEKFTNLYVKNLVDGMTEDLLEEMFSRYGKVCSVVVMKDGKGSSRGFGFVNFQSPDDAKKALEAMNGVQLGSKNLFVGRAQKKAERTELLKHKYKDVFNSRFEKLKASNLYVKNLNVSIDDKKLQELFGQFGKITSARVMRYDNGMSKGFGFVCFSCPREAMSALHGLNGTFFEGRNLYVAVAQRKEDRRLELQNYFVQNTPVQSSYQASCKAVSPQFCPFYFSIPPCPPLFPLQPQPTLSQNSITNVGIQYPFATSHDQQNFSYDLMRNMHPCNAGIRKDWVCRQSPMTYANPDVRIQDLGRGNSGNKKVGFRKKGNRKYEPAEKSSVAVAAIQSVAAASPGSSKKNNENLSCPFVENLEVTGELLEIKNSDVLKLLNSNSMAVRDKPFQVLKKANARTSRDAVTFANPKSARCLSY